MKFDQIRNQITKRCIVITATVIAILPVLYFSMSWYIVTQALKTNDVFTEFTYHPDEWELTYEDVEFHPRGDELITLRGWWLPVEDAVGSIIWVHGVDKDRSVSLPLLRDLTQEGFSVLAFDLRGHGQSDIVPLGAGYKEPADVRGAIDFLLAEKEVPFGNVLLMGSSFGASIVLMAGVGEPAVAGVYADSPFASLPDLMIAEIEMRTPAPSWLASMLRPGILRVGSFMGIELDQVRPEHAVESYTDVSIGLAHCREDERIPMEHSVRIRAASPLPVWFNLYPRCAHDDAYWDFPEQYVAIVTDYFLYQLDWHEAQP
jgi:pimeloyl-ACP methyl ester carboxylesterase